MILNLGGRTDTSQLKDIFTKNIFAQFTDKCGGSPSEFADILYARYDVEDITYADDYNYWSIRGFFEKVVVPHKIAVFQAGQMMLNQDWFKKYIGKSYNDVFLRNLWLHDMSKFSSSEAFGYAFYDRKTNAGRIGFERAWHHHKMHNEHHIEYWMNPDKTGISNPIEMPKIYILEMVADWLGASESYGTKMEVWIEENFNKFNFGENKIVVESILNDLLGEKWQAIQTNWQKTI